MMRDLAESYDQLLEELQAAVVEQARLEKQLGTVTPERAFELDLARDRVREIKAQIDDLLRRGTRPN